MAGALVDRQCLLDMKEMLVKQRDLQHEFEGRWSSLVKDAGFDGMPREFSRSTRGDIDVSVIDYAGTTMSPKAPFTLASTEPLSVTTLKSDFSASPRSEAVRTSFSSSTR